MSQITRHISVIGETGIFVPDDAYEYIMQGAGNPYQKQILLDLVAEVCGRAVHSIFIMLLDVDIRSRIMETDAVSS
jgi:hypothetical protein